MRFSSDILIFSGLSLALLSACNDNTLRHPDDDGSKDITLNFGRGGAEELTNNTIISIFHIPGEYDGGFRRKPDLTKKAENQLTLSLGEGKWDFRMVSGMTPDVVADVIDPEYGVKASDAPLYKWNMEDAMPEIYTADIPNVEISGKWVMGPNDSYDYFQPDRDYNFPAEYTRNVAKVVLNFEKSEDLKAGGQHKVFISNVPSTISWSGELYPNKNNPDVCETPLSGDFNLIEVEGEDNRQIGTNELSYIIPAHRGQDYANPATAVDTTTSLLRLAVQLDCKDGSQVRKENVILPYAPRMNAIYNVTVSYNKRKLNITTQIIPWVDHNLNADLANKTIITDKGAIGFSQKDTIRIDCKTPITVSKAADASWLTLRNLGNNMYEVSSTADSYFNAGGNPRSTYLSIVTGNLEKRVPVTQRPEKHASIHVEVANASDYHNGRSDMMWLSPPHNTKAVKITTTGGGWKTLNNYVANGLSGPVGESTTNIVRQLDENIHYDDYDAAYGVRPVVFANTTSLETDTIYVDNLFIGADDDVIEIAQPSAHNDTLTNTTSVYVAGGAKDITIISVPSFIGNASQGTRYNPSTGVFTFRSFRHPTGDDQWGDIVLGHKSDPDYRVTLPIDQAILVVIPEFDYFVVKFEWGNGDVDIKVGFADNPSTVEYRNKTYNTSAVSQINNKWVGYSYSPNPTTFGGKTLLQWGTDATQGQGETVFFNAREINQWPYPGQKGVDVNAANMLPRVLKLTINGSWWNSVQSGAPIKVSITCYLGGTMTKGTNNTGDFNNKNFYNQGGETVYSASKSYTSDFTVSGNSKHRHVCDIEYDRKKHSANIKWDCVNYVGR